MRSRLALILVAICGLVVGCGGVSKSDFDKVSNGMTYDEVVSAIGSKGEEHASTSMPGVGAASVYAWANSDGTNMTVMFQNGRVVSKAQFGLK